MVAPNYIRTKQGFPDSSAGKKFACNTGDPGSIPGSGRSAEEGIGYPLPCSRASLGAQLIKNHLQCERLGFDSWVGKIPWRRERLPTPVFCPGQFHRLYRTWGHKELDTTEWLSVQFSRWVVSDFATPWTTACQTSLSITNSLSLLKLMSIESVMPSNHLILCCPILLLSSICPSIRVFSNESVLHISWPEYWSFSFGISPSNEHPGLISFRMDWLDLLCSPRDSQESSPAPQFKSKNSSVLSFLNSPTLTPIYDHWKNHSLD